MFEGMKVGLRPIETSDVPVLSAISNDPRVRSLVVGWRWPSNSQSEQAIADTPKRGSGTIRLSVFDLAEGKTIGLTGLWEIDEHNSSAQTGIKLDLDRAPKGAGRDAIMLLSAWAFLEVGLRRLSTTILPFNAASLRAYVHYCGWTIEGRDREAIFRAGRWHDLIRIGLLAHEFDSHPQKGHYASCITPISTVDVSGDAAVVH